MMIFKANIKIVGIVVRHISQMAVVRKMDHIIITTVTAMMHVQEQ